MRFISVPVLPEKVYYSSPRSGVFITETFIDLDATVLKDIVIYEENYSGDWIIYNAEVLARIVSNTDNFCNIMPDQDCDNGDMNFDASYISHVYRDKYIKLMKQQFNSVNTVKIIE